MKNTILLSALVLASISSAHAQDRQIKAGPAYDNIHVTDKQRFSTRLALLQEESYVPSVTTRTLMFQKDLPLSSSNLGLLVPQQNLKKLYFPALKPVVTRKS
jgi:hypothetical protein